MKERHWCLSLAYNSNGLCLCDAAPENQHNFHTKFVSSVFRHPLSMLIGKRNGDNFNVMKARQRESLV